MKILFSFECISMPIRASIFINFLVTQGHIVDLHVPFDKFEGKSDIRYTNFYKDIENINLNYYDVWMHDLLNYDELYKFSKYNFYFKNFNKKLVIINYDDGSIFFEYRIEYPERVNLWMNNLLFKDKRRYPEYIRDKCMLVPSYIEESNKHFNYINDNIIEFTQKNNRLHFSGTLTGGLPAFEHRAVVVSELKRSNIDKIIRVCGHENHITLKWYYDFIVPSEYKLKSVEYLDFINEMNNSKYIFALKGNGMDPTRRCFESLFFNSLTFMTKNNYTEYLAQPQNEKHVVDIEIDGSDVLDKLDYYCNNLYESENIANNGRLFWEQNCRIFNECKLNDSIESYLSNGLSKHNII